MDLSTFKSLTIGGMRLKKLQTSTGVVLFQQELEPRILPIHATFVQYDASQMIPSRIYIVHRDQGGSPIQFSAPIYQRSSDWVWYYGNQGSISIDHLIQIHEGTPYNIKYRTSTLYDPISGHGVSVNDSDQQKSYLWTNNQSSTQTQTINLRWGSVSGPTTTQLTLDALTYRNESGSPILSVNEGNVGYTSTVFGDDETYDFNAHRGEEFRLTTPGGANTISFVIG